MNLIDTHAHLQFKAYDPDREKVVERNSKELEAVINVGAALDSSEGAVKLSEKIDNFYSSVGVHPHHSDQWDQETLDKLTKLTGEEKVVAIGEIGLDLNQYTDYPKPRLEDQTKMLHDQIGLSIEKNLPVIFHCRDAYEELLGEIAQYKGKIRGVMHCFIGSLDQAEKFLSFGLYLSFTGNITYKNNDSIREVAKNTPNDKILIETDSPYLPPEPYRGARNEPIYVKMVASKIAELKNLSFEEVSAATSNNAKTLFKINYVH
jgi:TatD DNase family protein